MKKILTTCTALLLFIGLWGQSPTSFWQDMPVGQMGLPDDASMEFSLGHVRSLSLDLNALGNYLQAAPMEDTEAARTAPLLLELPMPDGTMEQFAVWQSPIMEPGLAALFPQIHTYAGRSVGRAGVTLRFDHMPNGFHAMVMAPGEVSHITPYVDGQSAFYKSYFLKDVDLSGPASQFACGAHGPEWVGEPLDPSISGKKTGTDGRVVEVPFNRHQYRLAMATTVEYGNDHGGTVSSVMMAVTTLVNNINGVFERDAAIRLILVANNSSLYFFGTNGSDPYSNGNEDLMIDENGPVLNAAIGVANYDIGHVVGTNGGGLAQLASVCGANKSRGASGSFGAYTTDLHYIIVGHEIGHQFNANHTFNKCNDDDGFEAPPSAYEPGSGASIMCYNGNGVCGDNHTQPTSDPYFHINSMERIRSFSRNTASGGTCAQVINIANESPVVDQPFGNGVVIPISTPFELDATVTDPEGDPMTYSWEQYDLGPPSNLGSPIGTAPLFRSYPPSNATNRVFPRMDRVVNNVSHPHEVLPTTSRVITFRMTARDNNTEAGAYSFGEVQFNSTAAAGPFLVTYPNATGVSLEVGQYVEVKWDVANTNVAPVNCQKVNLRLSTDGGFTYPITLLANTPNDGSAFVTMPDAVSSTARVRVDAADNIFFDISNNNFSIVPPTQPGFALVSSPELGLACVPDAFEVDLQTSALLGFAENITFSVTGLPPGAVATFSTNPVAPGSGTTMSINFDDVTADGNFTATITASANGVADAVRTVMLNVVYNDFSDMMLLTPAGASGTSTLPAFTWSALPNAQLYDIQISDVPDFSNIIDQATGLSSPSYSPSIELSEGTVHYWRIASTNECGTGEWSTTAAFKTVSQSCDLITKEDVTVISGAGLPLIESTITVPTGGTISDVNVKNIRGKHDTFGDLEFRITGPDNTTVVMASAVSCFSTQQFNLGFNDQAPSATIPCPPSAGLDYQPANPLAAFNGKDSQGPWKLSVEVINTLGAGGQFDGWSLEVCGSFQGQDPFLVKNETLAVPPNDSRLVYSNKLIVEDPDNLPSQLQFTIVDDVQNGFLSVGGTQLAQGDHFTMMDVYASQVQYTNTNPAAEADFFTFTVDDGNGGFFGTPVFNIVIDADAPPSAVGEILPSANVLVYPNPTSGMVNVEFLETTPVQVTAAVLNVQGQVLLLRKIDARSSKFQLDLNGLPAGIHLLRLTTAEGILVKKLVIE